MKGTGPASGGIEGLLAALALCDCRDKYLSARCWAALFNWNGSSNPHSSYEAGPAVVAISLPIIQG